MQSRCFAQVLPCAQIVIKKSVYHPCRLLRMCPNHASCIIHMQGADSYLSHVHANRV